MTDVIRPFETKIVHGKYCPHNSTLINEDQRIVSCAKCSATLDPFDVLLKHSRYRQNLVFDRKHLDDEKERAATELEEVKRQLRNAKASLRRVEK